MYTEWRQGIAIEPPVYLDANILVGFIIRNHRLYRECTQVVGELLASGSEVLVSLLSLEESFWALARLSYYELARQRPDALFSQKIYKKWLNRIFTEHRERFEAVGRMLQDWSKAGLPVKVAPKTEREFGNVSELAPIYMRRFSLTPADATHLALAEIVARTFITADKDFQTPAVMSALPNLLIVHVAPRASTL